MSPTSHRLAEMGEFVVHLGFTPAAYWSLTWAERGAILTALEAKAKARKGR